MDLKALKASLPKGGAVWVEVSWLEKLLTVLIADRARLMEGSGIEISTTDGRFFLTKSANDLPLIAVDIVAVGVPRKGRLPLLLDPVDEEEEP